jgi:hypothetical protein
MCRKLFFLIYSVLLLSIVGNASAELVAHLPLDEGSGKVTQDVTGNGHDGTLTDEGILWAEGKLGSCIELDGAGYIDVAGPNEIEIGGADVTIALWLKSSAVGVFAMSAIGKLDPTVHSSQDRVFGINSAGQWEMYQYGVGALTSPTFIRDGDWHHVVFSQEHDYKDSYDLWNFYVDAELMATRGDFDSGDDAEEHIIRIGQGVGPVGGSFIGAIDDIRIYNHALTQAELRELIPLELYATLPYPRNGAKNVSDNPALTWRSGIDGAQHELYIGTSPSEVMSAEVTSSDIYKGRQALDSYTFPEPLEWGETYYWRIDEVNDAQADSPWKGDVWGFTVANFIVVDDFESYNDIVEGEEGSNLVYYTWLDGLDNPSTNGSTMGYFTGWSLESDVVHGGGKSAPFMYDNSVAGISEIQRQWETPQDWTANNLKSLTLWFEGDPANSAEPLYILIEDSAGAVKVLTHDGPAAVQLDGWQEWNILLSDLSDSGLNLAAIKKMCIGVGNKDNPQTGDAGTLYLDDIRVYIPRCRPEIAQPRCDFNGDCVVDELDLAILESEMGSESVRPEDVVEAYREVESADTIAEPMMIWDDPEASGGQYMEVQPGTGGGGSGANEDLSATYDINVSGGVYQLLGRTLCADGKDDSFWIRIQGATTNRNNDTGWVRWGVVNSSEWMWTPVRSMDDADKTVLFTMEAGSYTVEITYREDGAKIDAFLLTDDMEFDISIFNPLRTDLNEDGKVDAEDRAILMESWLEETLWP